NLSAFIPEFPEITKTEAPGTYIIVENSDGDPFLLLLEQCVVELFAKIIKSENIVLEMDVVFGIADVGEQTVEFIPSIYKCLDGIIECQKRLVIIQEHVNQFLVFFGNRIRKIQSVTIQFIQLFLHQVLQPHFFIFVNDKKLLVVYRTAEKDVDEESYDWQEKKDEYPCPYTLGASPFQENQAEGEQKVDGDYNQGDDGHYTCAEKVVEY